MAHKLFYFVFTFLLMVSALAQNPASTDPATPYTPGLDTSVMERSADPCTDFFQYSCRNWLKKNPIPADQSSWDTYGKMQEENEALLKRILEDAAAKKKGRSANEQKIGDYYGTCVDEPTIEKHGIKPIQAELDAIAGIKDCESLAKAVAHFHLNTYSRSYPMFTFGSEQDAKNSEEVIAGIAQSGLGLPDRDYYLKDDARSQEIRKRYLEHVQTMLRLIGDWPDAVKAEADTILRMETALAKASLTKVEQRNPNKVYHRMTREKLAELAPSFPWDLYFLEMGVGAIKDLDVSEPDFMKGLEELLKSESLNNWKVYLRWHTAHQRAPYLFYTFVKEDFEFNHKFLRGTKEQEPRWKRCVQRVDRHLGEALGQVYVAKYFTEDTKQRTLRMVQQIERAMEKDIQTLSWMSDATKRQALEKLHTVVNKIGYPDKWRDYSSLNIAAGEYLGNAERAMQFEQKRQLAKIGKPLVRGEWYLTPPTVNANYDAQMNDINFPAGVLQPPAFDPKMDDAPNYGNTGGTIGHELTHGFDDEGRQFDAKGNLRDWWTETDAKEFERRAACISDQYSQFVIIDDIKINGKLTLGEDVADLGGLIIAYAAWQEEVQNKKLASIDGLTPEQRFFVGYAQSWCGDDRDETKRLRAVTDPHSPGKWRTNGVVSNMPEFVKAFSCKKGQQQVRENICKVW